MCNNIPRGFGNCPKMISPNQEEFIRDLDRKLGYNTDEMRNFSEMTSQQASSLITELKYELEG